MSDPRARIICGRILSFVDEPRLAGARAMTLIEDGAALIEHGRIAAVGEAAAIRARAPAGAAVKEAAHDVGGGRLVATFTDPDGNVLGLLQDR